MTEIIHPSEGADYQTWMAQPDVAADNVNHHAVVVEEYSPFAIGTVAVLAAGVAIKAARNLLPGWGPLIANGGEWLLERFYPDKKIEAKKAQKLMSSVAWEIINIIEQMPKDDEAVQEIKARIKTYTPPEFEKLFQEWKVAQGLARNSELITKIQSLTKN